MGMADRHNSTLAVRASDRKFAEPEQPETAESDPLTELARVVSGRGRGGAAAAARARGNVGAPDLIRSMIVLTDEKGILISPVLRNGRPENGMPKPDLTEPQIADMVGILDRVLRELDL